MKIYDLYGPKYMLEKDELQGLGKVLKTGCASTVNELRKEVA